MVITTLPSAGGAIDQATSAIPQGKPFSALPMQTGRMVGGGIAKFGSIIRVHVGGKGEIQRMLGGTWLIRQEPCVLEIQISV